MERKFVLANKLSDSYIKLEIFPEYKLYTVNSWCNATILNEHDVELIILCNQSIRDGYVKVPYDKFLEGVQEIIDEKERELNAFKDVFESLKRES